VTADSPAILRAWQEAGLVEVDLPSGFRVRIRPVSPSQLITGGLLPYELIGALVAAEDQGAKPSAEVIGMATLAYLGKEHELAAHSVRDIWNGDAWERIEIPVTAFVDGTFPPDDVELITETAMSRIRMQAEQEGVDTSDLGTFPDQRPGDVDRPDGGEVRPTPLDARRDRRAAARPAARRGDRVSPRPS
jgi:hypothetical protein